MKKITMILAALFVASICVACNRQETSNTTNRAEDDGVRTDMTAMEFAADMGIGWNLGNTMEAYWEDLSNTTSGCQTIGDDTPENYETCWGAIVTTQEIIDGIKASGFSTVRIPVYWGNMMEDDGTYTLDEAYLGRIEELIEYCRNDDLYVVINMHHYDEYLLENHDKEEVLDAVETIWTQIATYFVDASDYLVFEGFNEALGTTQETDDYTEDEIFAYVNEMNQTFVDAVRATGGNNANRLLIVSGYWTNIDLTTDERFVLPEDSTADRLMVSVHYVDNAKYWANQIGDQAWLDYSREQCELLKERFTDREIPVFFGECTSIYEESRILENGIYTTSTECLEQILNLLTEYGFVPVLWDVTDNFYSRTDCEISSESDQALIASFAEETVTAS